MKFAVYLFLFIVFPFSLRAQPESWSHPEVEWHTLRTEHFEIHYHINPRNPSSIHSQGPYRTAQIVAKIAEEIYEPITSLYQHRPEKIHFIIRDTDDYSNGGAYYYDNKIEIWATSMDFELRGTHNWLRNVVTHEFTHMVSLQAMMKFSRTLPAFYLQYIGYEKERRKDVLRGFPNVIASYPIAGTILPIWFAEGVAQYQQKNFDYEFWDSHRDMILRSRSLSGELLTISQMSTFGKNSIGNESSYNQGYAFVSYLASIYGEEVLRDICRYSRKPLYSFERAFHRATGKPLDEVYNAWVQQIETIYEQRTVMIRENLRIGKPVATEGTGNFFPTISPDGYYMAFLSNRGRDYLSQTSLYITDRTGHKVIHRILEVDGPFSWSPDSRTIVYSKNLPATKNKSQVNDVYLLEVATKKEHRLTYGLRARAPAFSPDGNSLAVVINDDGTNNLYLIRGLMVSWNKEKTVFRDSTGLREGLELIRLTDYRSGEQIYKPVFHPSGNKIIFDISRDHGRNIAEWNFSTHTVQTLIKSVYDERSPVYDRHGNFIYYASDPTGIFNIYRFDPKTGLSDLITNSLGGAFYPFVHNGSLLYTLYNRQSFQIYSIDSIAVLDPSKAHYQVYNPNYREPVFAESDERLIREYYPQRFLQKDKSYHDTLIENPLSSVKYKTTFLDFMFMPVFRWDYGKPKPGIYTYSGDVLGKSSFFGGAMLNYPDFDRDLFAIFEYGGLGPTVFLELYNITRSKTFRDNADPSNDDQPGGVKYESIQKNTFELREADIGVDFSLFAPRDFRFSYAHSEYFVKISGKEFRDGMYMPILKSGALKYFYGNDFALQWKFNNVRSAIDQEINPRGGRKFLTRYSYNMDNLISGFAFNPSYGSLETIYKKGYHHRIETTFNEYLPIPGTCYHTLEIEVQGGIIPSKVDSFYNFFGGGLIGLKGYSFYSMEGSRLALLKTMYRFPLLRNIDRKFGIMYLDKIYGGFYFGIGNAWSHKTSWDVVREAKRDIGFELRMEFYSFYVYPTRVSFDAAYGLDRFTSQGAIEARMENDMLIKTPQLVRNGKEWRFYLTVLFGFTLFD